MKDSKKGPCHPAERILASVEEHDSSLKKSQKAAKRVAWKVNKGRRPKDEDVEDLMSEALLALGECRRRVRVSVALGSEKTVGIVAKSMDSIARNERKKKAIESRNLKEYSIIIAGREKVHHIDIDCDQVQAAIISRLADAVAVEVWILSSVDLLAPRQIAERLNCPVKSVYAKLKRARAIGKDVLRKLYGVSPPPKKPPKGGACRKRETFIISTGASLQSGNLRARAEKAILGLLVSLLIEGEQLSSEPLGGSGEEPRKRSAKTGLGSLFMKMMEDVVLKAEDLSGTEPSPIDLEISDERTYSDEKRTCDNPTTPGIVSLVPSKYCRLFRHSIDHDLRVYDVGDVKPYAAECKKLVLVDCSRHDERGKLHQLRAVHNTLVAVYGKSRGPNPDNRSRLDSRVQCIRSIAVGDGKPRAAECRNLVLVDYSGRDVRGEWRQLKAEYSTHIVVSGMSRGPNADNRSRPDSRLQCLRSIVAGDGGPCAAKCERPVLVVSSKRDGRGALRQLKAMHNTRVEIGGMSRGPNVDDQSRLDSGAQCIPSTAAGDAGPCAAEYGESSLVDCFRRDGRGDCVSRKRSTRGIKGDQARQNAKGEMHVV